MSVSIQDVLALLPELFPGTQEVPLANIRLNPDNPGPAASEEEIADLAANIEAVGLKNPVKLRPEPTGPLAPGVTLHSENPRLALASSPLELAQPKNGPQLEASAQVGRPWRVEDFIYRLMSGQSRLRAFQRLQRPTIPAGIQNPTEEEAVIIGRTDNRVRDKGWWADYKDVENIIRANPNLTQEQVGTRLNVSDERVNWAIRLLPLLNPQIRNLITRIPSNYNKGIWGISETSLFRLTDLGPGTGLKRGPKRKASTEGPVNTPIGSIQPVPAETQDLFRRALQVACDEVMVEAEAKRLVAWVKQGNKPEEFGKTQRQSTPSGEKASFGTEVATSPYVKTSGDRSPTPLSAATQAGSVHLSTDPQVGGQVLVAPSQSGEGTGATQAGSVPDLHSQVGTAIASHELGKRLHIPTQLMNQHLPRLTRLFHRARGLFTGLGIKNPTLATFLTLLLFLFTGSALINLTSRLVNGLCNIIFYPRLSQVNSAHLSPDPQVGGQALVAPSRSADGNGGTQVGSVHLSPGPQGGGQGLVVPSQSGDGNGATKVGSAHLSPGPQGGGQGLVVPSQSGEGTGATKAGSVQASTKQASTKQAPNHSGSPTPAKGGDVLDQIGAGVKSYQSAVNTADQAKAATDKAKGILGL